MSDFENRREAELDKRYREAREIMVTAIVPTDYDQAILIFKAIEGYRDSSELIQICRKRKDELSAKQSEDKTDWNLKYKELKFKKIKNIGLVIGIVVLWVAALIILFTTGPSTPTM